MRALRSLTGYPWRARHFDQLERAGQSYMTGTGHKPILSVVIGFRDWDLAHLRAALESHLAATLSDQIEVVVSDCSSRDCDQVEALCRELGCVYTYSDDTVWSRSRALNAGIVASRGDFIITTDADFIFTPKTHEIVLGYLAKYPNSLQLKQNMNLPRGITVQELKGMNASALSAMSTSRPRWGMGGMAAFHRDTADRLRGYDERMEIWGAEDNDFAKRVRASGGVINWISDQDAQVFHIWHPPFLQAHPDAMSIAAANHDFRKNDPSIIRNLRPDAVYQGRQALVSVVLYTSGSSPLLDKSVASVLRQDFNQIELILIDDSADDQVANLVETIADRRIIYHRNKTPLGRAGSWSVACTLASGRYIAIHGDSDLMLPSRLQEQLGHFQPNVQGVYGGWIGFCDDDESLNYFPGKSPFSIDALCFADGVICIETVMLDRDAFVYLYAHANAMNSEFDGIFNLAAAGGVLSHCGGYVSVAPDNPDRHFNYGTDLRSGLAKHAFMNRLLADEAQASASNGAAVKQPELTVPMTDLVAVQTFVPNPTYVPVYFLDPKPLDHYDACENRVILGRIQAGQFEARCELRQADDNWTTDVDAQSCRGDLFLKDALSFVVRGGHSGREHSIPAAAASAFSTKERLIVLESDQGGTLDNVLPDLSTLLPECEDIVCYSDNGCWVFGFEQGPSIRRRLVADKLQIARLKFDQFDLVRVSE